MKQLRMAPSSTRYDPVVLTGGLDLLTPILQLKNGYVRDSLNWEQSITGGYTRIKGYERFDGRPAPSLATYQTITLVATPTISPGQTITGATSAATGQVISVNGPIVAFTKAAGTFTVGETINVSGTPQGVVHDLGGMTMDPEFDVTQRALAANVYRAPIQQVPGSGPVRGVATLNGETYAWRNNIGGTALAIYRATSTGWVLVPLLYEVAFTAGATAYPVGSTLTQGGVSAVVRRVSVQNGAWGASGDGAASGRLIIDAPTGGNFASGASVGDGGATLSGAQTPITLMPGGFVQWDLGNFDGTPKIYGCDGENRAFEFDGEVLTPISTGNVPDNPQAVTVHKDHLFLAFGTNFQHSGITTPMNWTALAGSAAYRCADWITVMLRQPGDQSTGALAISTKTTTEMLYGSSAANFQHATFEESAGAVAYSGQRLGGQSLVFSDLGVFSLTAAQQYGNFTPSSMTLRLRPFTQSHRDSTSASVISREKSQYRVFFSDGFGLYLTVVNGKLLGAMPVFFPNDVTCACPGGKLDNQETALFGSSNGFVYRLDAGTSFDGQPIDASFTMTYAFQGNSRIFKSYRGISFECQGGNYATFNVTYDLGYGGLDRPQGSQPQKSALQLKSSYWDAFTWDQFTWDGRSIGPSHVEMHGTEVNVAFRVQSSSDRYDSITINSAIVHYLSRKAIKK